PYTITINSAGTYAYVVNANSGGTTGTAMAFAINTSTGAFTPAGTAVNTGNTPQFIAVTPAGSYAYVANSADNTIGIYSIGNT
ncbi:beta-propeller fold lactonase family protein, partial [Vibrio owensii]|uniref:beta-propeller fold lactonase family protein n=2 Tax=Pseudomonadota TaxID=1224 RepID=UPI004068B8B9